MAAASVVVTQMVFCVIAVLLVLLVARTQRGREMGSRESRSARDSFVMWWLVLAVYFIEQLLFNASRLFMDWGPSAFLALKVFETAIVVIGFGFLLNYLLYIVAGDLRWRRRVITYYAFLFVLIAVVAPLTGPYNVVETSTGPSLEGGIPGFGVAALLVMMAPVMGAMVLQIVLLWKADDRTIQYRIAMVIFSVLFLLLALGVAGEAPANIDWTIGSAKVFINGGGIVIEGLIPLMGAWLAYRAYKPAAWVEKQFGIQSV